MAIFRLLHTSDLHIAHKPERVGLPDIRKAGLCFPRNLPLLARASSYSPDLLDGLIEFVYNQGDRLDAVLISGDLSTSGTDLDLRQALACIDGDTEGLWYNSPTSGRLEVASHRALKGAGKQIILLPGNHDRFDGPLFLPGGTLFDRHFAHYWNVGRGVQGDVLARGGAHLGLVSADLSLRKGDYWTDPLGAYGQGNADAQVIQALKWLTKQMRIKYPDLGLLWVIHFPPAYPQVDEALRLLDEQALINAAQKVNISHILSGHTHYPRSYRATSAVGSTVEVLCAGTATQGVAPGGNFIHELEIDVGRRGSVSISFQTFKWDDAYQQWAPVPCPL